MADGIAAKGAASSGMQLEAYFGIGKQQLESALMAGRARLGEGLQVVLHFVAGERA